MVGFTSSTPSLNEHSRVDEGQSQPREVPGLSLNEDEIRFLTQVQRYSAHLSESDRRLLLAMVRKFAATSMTS